MAEGNGLRDLQMGEAGHDGVRFAFGEGNDGGLQAADFAKDALNGGAGVEADVGRHLVVARAPGMQAFARVADAVGQAFFDVHMHIFQRRIPDEFTARDFIGYRIQPARNRLAVGLA